MIFNKVLFKSITQQDKQLLCKVMDALIAASDYINADPNRRDLTVDCHSICRALAQNIPELQVVDGVHLGLTRRRVKKKVTLKLSHSGFHSWLRTPHGAIIDAYPMGFISANPVLIPTKGHLRFFASSFYIEDPATKKQVKKVGAVRAARILAKHIKTALAERKKAAAS